VSITRARTSAVHAEMALATKRLAKGSCGPPDDATMAAASCCVQQARARRELQRVIWVECDPLNALPRE
jgi:hypothetical protein